MRKEMPNERICIQPLFGIALSILAYLVGMLIYRRFPHPLTTPLLFVSHFYHYFP